MSCSSSHYIRDKWDWILFNTAYTQSESGLVEYQAVAPAVNKEIAAPPAKRKRGSGKYSFYTPSQRAMIGKYAMRQPESITCLNFLTYLTYSDKMLQVWGAKKEKKGFWCTACSTVKPKGRPPILPRGRQRPGISYALFGILSNQRAQNPIHTSWNLQRISVVSRISLNLV